MSAINNRHRRAKALAGAAIAFLVTSSASSALLQGSSMADVAATSAAFETILKSEGFVDITGGKDEYKASERFLARGQWAAACRTATDTLADRRPNIDALGVFALCAAIRNDESMILPSLERLVANEPPPQAYVRLVQAVLHLKEEAPGRALEALEPLRSGDVNSPLASYFAGEALHAQGRDAAAVEAFQACLDLWPEHAPAMVAIARLSIGMDGNKGTLEKAIAMTEQATRIEPSNLGYWRQLADLCERNGEFGRASAIRMQWLTPRFPK
jgi:tetratricopeptide (TPR) repeat protein